MDIKNSDQLMDYSQVSRHKKVKNFQERPRHSVPSIMLLLRQE